MWHFCLGHFQIPHFFVTLWRTAVRLLQQASLLAKRYLAMSSSSSLLQRATRTHFGASLTCDRSPACASPAQARAHSTTNWTRKKVRSGNGVGNSCEMRPLYLLVLLDRGGSCLAGWPNRLLIASSTHHANVHCNLTVPIAALNLPNVYTHLRTVLPWFYVLSRAKYLIKGCVKCRAQAERGS